MRYLLILIILISGSVWAGEPADLPFGKVPATSVQILDQPRAAVIDHLDDLDQLPWRPASGGLFGTSGGKRWLRIDVRIPAAKLQPLVLTINNAANRSATLYLVRDGKVLQKTVFGSEVPLAKRAIPIPNPTIPLKVDKPGDYTILVSTRDVLLQRMLVDMSLEPERQLGFVDLPRNTGFGAGILSILFSCFLFLFGLLLWQRRIEYAYVSLLVFSACWTIMLREGLLYPVLGWYGPWWDENAVIGALSCTLGSAALYLRERLRPLRGWLDSYTRLSGWLLYLFAGSSLFMNFFTAVTVSGILYFNVLLVLSLLVVVTWRRAWRGSGSQWVFATVWTLFTALTCMRFARIPYPDLPLGSLTEWNYGFMVLTAWISFEYLREVIRHELQRRQVETAATSRIEMVNRLSHEIRTPLNAVIGLADLLRTQRDPVITRNYAGMIRNAGQTLLHLVNDILDFSKFGESQSELAREPFRLDKVMTDVFTSVLPQVTGTGLIFKPVVDTDIPYFLLGDALRIKQILSNLIGNAVKFSPVGGTVEIRLRRGDAIDGRVQILCEVADQGRGIPEDRLQVVFEPYVQTEASDHSRLQGTGLGLAISRLLVQSMGGSIRAESAVGEGTTFCFDLWLETDPAAPDLFSLFAPLAGTRVAFVACQDILRERIGSQLSYYGADVKPYRCFEEFLEASIPFDLLLTESLQTLSEEHLELLAGIEAGQPLVVLEPEPRAWLNATPLENVTSVHLPCPVLSIIGAVVTAMTDQAIVLPGDEGVEMTRIGIRYRHRVLVVDDNALNLMVCGKLLESLEVSYVTVQGGREALDILQDEDFTLILLDCEMPDVDGFQVARKTRERETEQGLEPMPIVALTAHALDDVRERCLGSGMNEVMHKPITRQDLAAVVARYPLRSSADSLF